MGDPTPIPECEDHGPHGPHRFVWKQDLRWRRYCPGSGPEILHRDNGSGYDQFPLATEPSEPWWATGVLDPARIRAACRPTSPIRSKKDPTLQIEEWLDEKRTTLWSTFNIGPEGNTRKAAEWFLKELESFTKFVEGNK